MSLSNRIRIELLLGGPMGAGEIAKRIGMPAQPLHCYLKQLLRTKKDGLVVVRKKPTRVYALRRQHTALSEVWR